VVSSAGEIRAGSESIRLHPTGEFQNIDELGSSGQPSWQRHHPTAGYCHVVARAERLSLQYLSCQRPPGGDHGVSFIPGVNVIDVGVRARPGWSRWPPKNRRDRHRHFYDQAAEVAHSVNGFITNFLMALAIVVGVLLVFMGVRSGIIIALSLALNVLGTLLIMYMWDRATADLAGGADYRPEYAGGQCHRHCRRGADRPPAGVSAAERDNYVIAAPPCRCSAPP
jgi:multidrug efflux pump subunit AcrB